MMSGDANALAAAHALGPSSGAVNSIDLLKRGLLAFGSLPGTEGIRPHTNQLYVRGLPSDTTDADLLEIFAPFGAIPPRGVKAMLNAQGLCTGVAWVDYIHEADAKAALETLNNKVWSDGSCLRIHVKFMKS
jgi:RNA recognition motif-containing protein